MKRREVLVNLLRSCNNTDSVSHLHSHILKTGFAHDSFFATKLTALYAKHTSLDTARKVFDETPQRTVYLWNSLLRSYCGEKQWKTTLYLFNEMISNRIMDDSTLPDNFTLSIVLKACAGLRAIEYGRIVHAFVEKNDKIGFELDMFVGAALVEVYSKCGEMGDALKVFKGFSQPDVVLWTSMVAGYEQNGYPEKAIAFFREMVVKEHVSPHPVTLVSLVSACAQLLNVKLGSCVHGYLIRRGFESDLALVNSLLNSYAKMGSVKVVDCLFRNMIEKDVISWSSMVACYAHNGDAVEALVVFRNMIGKGYEPNAVTLVSALQACSVSCNLEEGKKIHQLAANKGFEFDVSVSTALIDMYMKCFSPDEAVDIFKRMPKRDVVSWVALLNGYALNGMAHKSMRVFCEMLGSGVQPDAVAMVKILASCSELGILQQAVCIHGYVVRSGFDKNVFVGASLIELYSKCGSLENAIEVFEGVVNKDVVSWSTMIAGYAIHGQGGEALKLFRKMVKNSEVRPNNVTFLSVLSGCSHSGLVGEGIELFDIMVNGYKLKPTSEHYGIMVDLLGRKGELDKAMDIINQIPFQPGPHVWGALLGAARIHHNVKIGEMAAKNLFRIDPTHAGYYILLSNMHALDGKWGSVAKFRTLLKEWGLKKMLGQTVVEVKSEVHGFIADDRFHPECEHIYELLRQLEVKMREEGNTPVSELLLHDAEQVS